MCVRRYGSLKIGMKEDWMVYRLVQIEGEVESMAICESDGME